MPVDSQIFQLTMSAKETVQTPENATKTKELKRPHEESEEFGAEEAAKDGNEASEEHRAKRRVSRPSCSDWPPTHDIYVKYFLNGTEEAD